MSTTTNTPITLRAYEHGRDLEACVAIWRAASEMAHSFLGMEALASDEQLVRERYMPAAEITVAEHEGQVVGFIALIDSFVGGLFVDPSMHRRGVGRLLIEAAAHQKGALVVEVYQQNTSARSFYRSLGFRETGVRALDDLDRPHPLVTMERRVDENAALSD